MNFLSELSSRSPALFWYGWVCLLGAAVMLGLILTTSTQIQGINSYIKPFKFFLSIAIFSWTMGWFIYYLKMPAIQQSYTWTVIFILSFELIWITYKAAIGELSHFNTSSSFNAMMFSLMGIAISIMTLYTLYIGILFRINSFDDLSLGYLWGIRLGIICFVIFAFQGGMMGAQMSHTVGAPDGGEGLPLLNWSTKYGDYRIAHFVGMHALQLLPLAGYYILRSTKGIIIFSIIYFAICFGVLIQAMMKLPLIKS